MNEAVQESHEGKRRVESTWPVHRIHYEKNKYIYDLYFKNGSITKSLYDWLVEAKIADANLHAKWKKPGYEKLCNSLCISKSGHNYQATCACRVPLKKRSADRRMPCVTSGCISCCSSDNGAPIWWDSPPSLWKDVDGDQ